MKQQMPALGVALGRVQSWLLAVAVLVTIGMPAPIQIAGKSTSTSPLDNHPPAPFPRLAATSFDKFRGELDRFIADNFGLRAEMIVLNFWLRHQLGESSNPNTVQGRHGTLFLRVDHALDQFRGLDQSVPAADAWIDALERYRQWLDRRGVRLYVLIAPNRHTIYADYMPFSANRVWPETRLDQIVRRIRERGSSLRLIDPRGDLLAARLRAEVYHQYEDHWNNMGAFVGYGATMREIARDFPTARTLTLDDFSIQLARRPWPLPLPAEREFAFHQKSPPSLTRSVRIRENADGTQPIILSETTHTTAPKAVIYGDSFMGPMMHFFNETFAETIWLLQGYWPFPAQVIEERKPDLVILEFVERHLSGPPPPDIAR